MKPLASIVGIGALPVGRHSDLLEHEMMVNAFIDAVEDAGVTKDEIDSLVFSTPRPYADQRYFGTFMTSYLDMSLDDTLLEVLGNGLTGALAFDTAVERVASGRSRIAVALGVNREMHVNTGEHMHLSMRAVGDVDFHVPFGVTPISWYAFNATRYMHDYGLTREQLAAIPVKNRNHAIHNPIAQMRKPITIQDVIDARPIVRPLGLLDVPPRSDGAVAIVIAQPDIARRLGRYVDVVSRGFYHEGVHQVSPRPRSLTWFESAEIASDKAYADAGITASQLDFAEVYAPCSIVELILSESIGVVPRGEGGIAAAEGVTSLGGDIPISTSGGCASRGHPPLVTPLYNVYEAVQQLRGEAGDERQVRDARFGAVTGELGDYNATMMHILSNG